MKSNGHKPPTKKRLREELDRAVRLADRSLGVYDVDPKPAPRATGSVEPGTPREAWKIPIIPAATYDPVRAEGNWAPLRPAPKPIPGIVPGFRPGEQVTGEAQWGGTGTPITAGFLIDLGEYNQDLYGRSAVTTYEKMRRGDAQVWGTLMAVKGPLQSATWDIDPGIKQNDPGFAKAKEVAKFVKENVFGGLEFQTSSGGWHCQAWDQIIWNALLCLDFGCSIHEDVYTVDGRYLKLRQLVPLLPITYYRWHTETDGYTLLALEQYGYRGIEFINATVPAEKICRFTLNQEGSNFWGLSMLRACYPHWYIKSQLYRIDAMAAERNGLGVPVVTLPEGASGQDRAVAFNLVTKLSAHEMTGVVLPNGSKFEIVGPTGTPRDLNRAIEHHNRMISTTALAMFMTIGSAPHGSRATAATQHDFFLAASQHLATFVGNRFTETSIRRLVMYNFGPDAPIPKLIAKNVKMRDFEDVREALQQLATSGLLVSDYSVRSVIRDEYELPEETNEGVVTTKGEMVTEGESDQPGATPPLGAKSPEKKGEPPTASLAPPTGQRAKQKKGVPGPANGAAPNNALEASEFIEKTISRLYTTFAGDLRKILSDTPFARTDQIVEENKETLSDTPTVYYVRHGETEEDEDPAEEIVSSWSQVPLNDNGRLQAEQAGEKLKDKGIVEIYTSDLPRAKETAEIIGKIIGAEVIDDYGFRGWKLPWQGESVNSTIKESQAKTVGRRIKDEIDWYHNHPDVRPQEGDSYNHTKMRIADAVDRVSRREKALAPLGQHVAVVTHSRIMNSLPELSEGRMADETDDPTDALGSISKAVADDDHWVLTHNAKLSDYGYHSIGDDIIIANPRNRSGQPTQRRVQKKSPPGPPADTAQESRAARSSPAVGGQAPTKRRKPKPVPVGDVMAKQAEHGAQIVDGTRGKFSGFTPTASLERKKSPHVPDEMQPEDKQDTPLVPTPETAPVIETFEELFERALRLAKAGSRAISAVVGKKKGGTGSMVVQTLIFPKADWKSALAVRAWLKTHGKKSGIDETGTSYRARQIDPKRFIRDSFKTISLNSETYSETADNDDDRVMFEDHHGAQAAKDVRGNYDGAMSAIQNKIKDTLKAKAIRSVAHQAVRQLKAGVPVPQLTFVADHSLEHVLDADVTKMFDRASAQAKKEVQTKKKTRVRASDAGGDLPIPDPGVYDEDKEAEIRELIERHAAYAESGPTFDKTGKYLCGSCSLKVGDNGCAAVSGLINLETGSSRLWTQEKIPDQNWPKKVSQLEAGYSERPKAKGFGCSRCEYGTRADEPDSAGRKVWCGFWGTRVMLKACCAEEDGADLVLAPGEAN